MASSKQLLDILITKRKGSKTAIACLTALDAALDGRDCQFVSSAHSKFYMEAVKRFASVCKIHVTVHDSCIKVINGGTITFKELFNERV